MAEHGINVTYKAGTGYDEFWVTVGADDAETWMQRNAAVSNAIAAQAANTAATIRALNAVARETGGVEVVHQEQAAAPSPAAAPAQPAPNGNVATTLPAAGVASTPATPTPAAAPASPPLSVVEGELPASVRIWQGPNPERPQYTELFIDYPYNAGLSAALKSGMEAAGQKLFWNKTAKARTTRPENEALLRSLVVQNKHLLGA